MIDKHEYMHLCAKLVTEAQRGQGSGRFSEKHCRCGHGAAYPFLLSPATEGPANTTRTTLCISLQYEYLYIMCYILLCMWTT